MNKSELVSAIADRTSQPDGAVNAVLSAFEGVVTETVADGGKVQIPGFLTFEQTARSARTGRNPSTGDTMQIPAAIVPKVKVGKAFKDSVAR
jgi:DNA-binding protein HU-beta